MKNTEYKFKISCLTDASEYTCYRAEGRVIGQGNNQDECSNNATELIVNQFCNIGKLDIAQLEPIQTDVEADKHTQRLTIEREWSNSNTDTDIEPTQGTTITTKTIQR